MAKSIRSKIKKRYRTAKRQRVAKVVEEPRLKEKHAGLLKLMAGERGKTKTIKNAFLHPGDPEAQIPQKSVKTAVDFRSEHMPLSGYAYAGGRRKFTETEKATHQELNQLHPRIRIIAGKGAELEDSSMGDADAAISKPDTDMALDLKQVDTSRKPVVQQTGKQQNTARPAVHGKKRTKQNAKAAKTGKKASNAGKKK